MKNKKINLLLLMMLPMMPVVAQAKPVPSASHPVAIVMLSVIGLLAFVILLLGKVMLTAYPIYKKKKSEKEGAAVKAGVVLLLMLIGNYAFAQDTEAFSSVGTPWVNGISNTTMIFLSLIIALELIIIFYMVSVFRTFSAHQRRVKPKKVKVHKKSWWERFNNTKSIDARSEEELNLGHDYDGIEELDNPTPPWWQWGFVISAVFAVIYLYVYFVAYSAPNQFQELEIANAKAEEQIKNYMATSANNIDENTVTLLESETDIAEGKKIFTSVCGACHGSDGGGIVGPNLTDNYWLHGGTVNDIFRTIKYGVPEKGMKSWKDDYTPKQIAQLASFIISIHGTKPANPKDPEGELLSGESSTVNSESEP